MPALSFETAVLRQRSSSRFADFSDNYDFSQLGPEPSAPPSFATERWAAFRKDWDGNSSARGKFAAFSHLRELAEFYAFPKKFYRKRALENLKYGSYLYNVLEDQASRDLLVKILAYRLLGHRKVRLPRNTKEYWSGIKRAEDRRAGLPPLRIPFNDMDLHVHDLRPLGYDLDCYSSAVGVSCTVIQKQYEMHRGSVLCKAEPGDVVIDAGGCWGDTSIYFANQVGEKGRVLVFEFIPSNLAVIRKNIELNEYLRDRVNIFEKPLRSVSGNKLYFVDWGPGSRVTPDVNKYHSWEGIVETITIDEALASTHAPRVDFIKMDIEGAELSALKGAEKALKSFRPKLAISVYHSAEDFDAIPRYINELNLNYKFYLEHHTIYENETVLFAVPA